MALFVDIRETRLFPPVKAILQDRGYDVFGEVWGHDVVAIKDGQIVIVELKEHWHNGLWRQLQRASLRANAVYGASPKLPGKKYRDLLPSSGYGVILADKKSARFVSEPGKDTSYAFCREQMRMILDRLDKNDEVVGGAPFSVGGNRRPGHDFERAAFFKIMEWTKAIAVDFENKANGENADEGYRRAMNEAAAIVRDKFGIT